MMRRKKLYMKKYIVQMKKKEEIIVSFFQIFGGRRRTSPLTKSTDISNRYVLVGLTPFWWLRGSTVWFGLFPTMAAAPPVDSPGGLVGHMVTFRVDGAEETKKGVVVEENVSNNTISVAVCEGGSSSHVITIAKGLVCSARRGGAANAVNAVSSTEPASPVGRAYAFSHAGRAVTGIVVEKCFDGQLRVVAMDGGACWMAMLPDCFSPPAAQSGAAGTATCGVVVRAVAAAPVAAAPVSVTSVLAPVQIPATTPALYFSVLSWPALRGVHTTHLVRTADYGATKLRNLGIKMKTGLCASCGQTRSENKCATCGKERHCHFGRAACSFLSELTPFSSSATCTVCSRTDERLLSGVRTHVACAVTNAVSVLHEVASIVASDAARAACTHGRACTVEGTGTPRCFACLFLDLATSAVLEGKKNAVRQCYFTGSLTQPVVCAKDAARVERSSTGRKRSRRSFAAQAARLDLFIKGANKARWHKRATCNCDICVLRRRMLDGGDRLSRLRVLTADERSRLRAKLSDTVAAVATAAPRGGAVAELLRWADAALPFGAALALQMLLEDVDFAAEFPTTPPGAATHRGGRLPSTTPPTWTVTLAEASAYLAGVRDGAPRETKRRPGARAPVAPAPRTHALPLFARTVQQVLIRFGDLFPVFKLKYMGHGAGAFLRFGTWAAALAAAAAQGKQSFKMSSRITERPTPTAQSVLEENVMNILELRRALLRGFDCKVLEFETRDAFTATLRALCGVHAHTNITLPNTEAFAPCVARIACTQRSDEPVAFAQHGLGSVTGSSERWVHAMRALVSLRYYLDAESVRAAMPFLPTRPSSVAVIASAARGHLHGKTRDGDWHRDAGDAPAAAPGFTTAMQMRVPARSSIVWNAANFRMRTTASYCAAGLPPSILGTTVVDAAKVYNNSALYHVRCAADGSSFGYWCTPLASRRLPTCAAKNVLRQLWKLAVQERAMLEAVRRMHVPAQSLDFLSAHRIAVHRPWINRAVTAAEAVRSHAEKAQTSASRARPLQQQPLEAPSLFL